MIENPRKFTAGPDPFGRKWNVTFRWQQNGISIRHSDSIDNKFELAADDGSRMECVLALMHTDCLAVCKKLGRALTDAWCLHIAAGHLNQIVTSWEDTEKNLVTLSMEQIEDQARRLQSAVAAHQP